MKENWLPIPGFDLVAARTSQATPEQVTDRKIATVELRGLTACRCDASWRDRDLHEPMKGCASEYREDVDILTAAPVPPLPAEPDWIDDGVEHWETAGFWVERDATGRDGPTWRLNGDAVSRWVVERFRDVLNAALASPGAPLPTVPDGEDALEPDVADPDDVRQALRAALRGRDEYADEVDRLRALHADGADVPARLDAAAEALEALHSHGLGYELRQVADQLRDGDGGTPELRAAVAAALVRPTEREQ